MRNEHAGNVNRGRRARDNAKSRNYLIYRLNVTD